ncbi:MAG: TldD/PmbA family protein [Candidatus Odinarchaeota archaeon]
MKKLLEKAQKILDKCQDKGISNAEIYLVFLQDKRSRIEHNEISSLTSYSEQGCGIRIIENGGLGFSFTNSLDEKTIAKVIDTASSIARNSPKDDSNVLPAGNSHKIVNDCYDKEVAALTAEDISKMATQLIDEVERADKRINLTFSSVSSQLMKLAIVNSKGIEKCLQQSLLEAYLFGFARDGAKIGSFYYETNVSRSLDVKIPELVEKFVPKVIEGLDARTTTNFKGTVIYEPAAMFNPYLMTIFMSIEGNEVFHSRSKWRDKIGDEIAIPELIVEDLPLRDGKPSSRPFDDEGVSSENRTIIDDGILRTYLHTSKSAAKSGVEPTGNGYRSLFLKDTCYQRDPQLALPIGLTIRPGTVSIDELVEDTKRGIIIGRFSGNARSETGEYSGVAKQAYYVENGEIKYPLKEVMVAGNVFDDLLKISGITKETSITGPLYFESPHIRFEDIMVSTRNS